MRFASIMEGDEGFLVAVLDMHQTDCADGMMAVRDVAPRVENSSVAVVCNFTPVVRRNYRIGVPSRCRHRELLDTDAAEDGGSGVGSGGSVEAEAIRWHGRAYSLSLTLPSPAALGRHPDR